MPFYSWNDAIEEASSIWIIIKSCWIEEIIKLCSKIENILSSHQLISGQIKQDFKQTNKTLGFPQKFLVWWEKGIQQWGVGRYRKECERKIRGWRRRRRKKWGRRRSGSSPRTFSLCCNFLLLNLITPNVTTSGQSS